MKQFFLLFLTSAIALASGATLGNPPKEYKSENGLLDVTLSVGMVESLNGTRVAPGYNGEPVGPTLRVSPGDTLRVTLVNTLETSALDRELQEYVMDPKSDYVNTTIIYNRLSEIGNIYNSKYGYWGLNYANLHFHGLEVPPSKEEIHTVISDGESKTYELKIPNDQEPGLFWYHNHVHGTTVHAYLSSLMGAIIVEGTDKDITNAPGIEGASEVVMVFSEYLKHPEGNFPMPFFPIAYSFDWEAVTNGHLASDTHYEFTEGETVLFRAVSANVDPDQNFHVPGMTFYIVAYDGNPVANPKPVDTVAIPAGGRVEFIGKFEEAGSYEINRLGWGNHFGSNMTEFCLHEFNGPAPCISHIFDKPVGTIEVKPALDVDVDVDVAVAAARAGDAASFTDSIQLPEYSERFKCLEEKPITDKKTVVFKQKHGFPLFQIPYDGPFIPPGVGFGVGDKMGTPHEITGSVKENSCEEWHIEFNPPLGHPFHAHGAKFFLLKEGENPVDEVVWRDTYATFEQSIDIKICYDRIPSNEIVMVHCHAATHLDIGMFTWFSVESNPEGESCAVTVSDTDGNGGDDIASVEVLSSSVSLSISTALAGLVFGLVFPLFM